MTNKHLFSWLLKKAVSMALCTKATLFSYITPSFRPPLAKYQILFTKYYLCSLLEQSLSRTPSRLKTSIISVNPVILSNLSSCSSCASWLKNPFNQRKSAINALFMCLRHLYTCSERTTNSTFFMQNEPNFRKVK